MKRKTKRKNSECLRQLPVGLLSEREVEVISRQVRSNSLAIDRYIETIDLLVNKERCPKDANTLLYLRGRLAVAIAENDTFRKVLWRHMRSVEAQPSSSSYLDASSFLMERIRFRRNAVLAQLLRK